MDAYIPNSIKNEFRFQKDRILVDKFNYTINVAKDILYQLIHRVRLD